jgi:hypothetical protein
MSVCSIGFLLAVLSLLEPTTLGKYNDEDTSTRSNG